MSNTLASTCPLPIAENYSHALFVEFFGREGSGKSATMCSLAQVVEKPLAIFDPNHSCDLYVRKGHDYHVTTADMDETLGFADWVEQDAGATIGGVIVDDLSFYDILCRDKFGPDGEIKPHHWKTIRRPVGRMTARLLSAGVPMLYSARMKEQEFYKEGSEMQSRQVEKPQAPQDHQYNAGFIIKMATKGVGAGVYWEASVEKQRGNILRTGQVFKGTHENPLTIKMIFGPVLEAMKFAEGRPAVPCFDTEEVNAAGLAVDKAVAEGLVGETLAAMAKAQNEPELRNAFSSALRDVKPLVTPAQWAAIVAAKDAAKGRLAGRSGL